MFKVGDKVYSIIYPSRLRYCSSYKPQLNYPEEKKITQVVQKKDGTMLYQVKGYHFSEKWVGKLVYTTLEEAKENLDKVNDYYTELICPWTK